MPNPIEVRNPRSGKLDHTIEPLSENWLKDRCSSQRRAQVHWYEIGIEARIEVLKKFKQSLLADRERLTEALVNDTGRLSISNLEIDSVLATIDRWCKLAPELLQASEKNTTIQFIKLQQNLVPYSLVGVISPWNFPLLLATIDTIPALLAGCAVIVKPSEIASRFVAPLMSAIDAIPDLREVLTFVEGGGETGANLIESVDLICFTGSVATGQKVAAAAARQMIPACLELGGKDPAIVLASADIELATSATLWGSVVNTGQSCQSIERIYVAENIFTEFVSKLVAKANRLTLAYPTVDSGEIGPIISERQATIIREHLQDAKAKGAIVRCGGTIEQKDGGWWCLPTVLTHVNHDMKIMTEETFGPMMPIMSFDTEAAVINLANDTIYGLSAAVFGAETAALAVARQIDAGAISINDASLTAMIYEGEKNSFGYSGLGESRMGAAGLMRFLRKKALLIKTNAVADPWWF